MPQSNGLVMACDYRLSDWLPGDNLRAMQITGQCHCGAITLTAEAEAGTVVLCHCSDCQTFAGAPYRAMVRPAPGTLAMTGEPTHYHKTAQSGRVRVQGFCGTCGSHLYAMDPDGTNLGLRIGVVNERAELGAPMRQIWCSSALGWSYDLTDIPRLDRQA